MLWLRILVARRWLILGLLAGAVVMLLPLEMPSPAAQRTLAMLATAIVFLIAEPIPLPATALFIAVGQVVLALGEPNEVARSFMSDSVFFVMGSLMISVAIVKQKLDVRIAFGLMRLAGPSIGRLAVSITAISALLASVIGEHTVAAIMLPVALGILKTVEEDQPHIPNLSVLLLLCIVYGCAIAGLGTPSGGARNAIVIDYWRQLFDIHIDYATWVAYAYPMVILQIPFVPLVLWWTYRPEVRDLKRSLVRLRREVRGRGQLSRRDFHVIALFLVVLLGWITLSGTLGLGMVAIAGAGLYLATGLVRWDDLNSGVNWGVVWLYAAAISLGVQVKQTGTAEWLANHLLGIMGPMSSMGVLLVIALLMVLFTNIMSSGAAVAVLGSITLQMAEISGTSLIAAGFVTALASAFAFFTSFASPAAMIVYSSGRLQPSDFARSGAKLVVASVTMLMLLAWAYWPWLGLGQ